MIVQGGKSGGGGGGGTISGGGTLNFLAKFTGATSIGNSTVTDNGTTLTFIGGQIALAQNLTFNQNSKTLSFINTNVFSVQDGLGNDFLNIEPPNKLYAFGDIKRVANGTFINIDDDGQSISLQTNSLLVAQYTIASFYTNGNNPNVQLGSSGGLTNGTNFFLDDTAQTITMTAANGVGINMTPTSVSPFAIAGVPAFANDAAATGGGLTTGMLYKTTAGGSTVLKIVP